MRKERTFWGFFMIVSAVFLIISGIKLLPGIPFFKLLLTIFLTAVLIKSLLVRSFVGILFSIAFMCIVHANVLGIQKITPWPVLGAALLGSIGLELIFPRKHRGHFQIEGEETVEQMDGNVIGLYTNFGSSIKYVNSEELESAKLECSFGAMKVYFDHAVMREGKARLDMHVSFAGVELYVPREWRIKNQLKTSFGGVDEKGRKGCEGDEGPLLTLSGSISFSGVTIFYV